MIIQSHYTQRATEAVRTALSRKDVVVRRGVVRWPTRITPQLDATAQAIVDTFDVARGIDALTALLAAARIPATARLDAGAIVLDWQEIATADEKAAAAAALANIVDDPAADAEWIAKRQAQQLESAQSLAPQLLTLLETIHERRAIDEPFAAVVKAAVVKAAADKIRTVPAPALDPSPVPPRRSRPA